MIIYLFSKLVERQGRKATVSKRKSYDRPAASFFDAAGFCFLWGVFLNKVLREEKKFLIIKSGLEEVLLKYDDIVAIEVVKSLTVKNKLKIIIYFVYFSWLVQTELLI